MAKAAPIVGIIMGSTSDWETMQHTVNVLDELGVPHAVRVVSAPRTPQLLAEVAAQADVPLGLPANVTDLSAPEALPALKQKCAAVKGRLTLSLPTDRALMRVVNGLGNDLHVARRTPGGQWRALDHLGKALPRDVIHGEIVPTLMHAHFVDGNDVGVLERCSSRGFAAEALNFCIGCPGTGEH